ncbi:MAG: beta strand repeat-containing protein, partial [Phycisphaerales bacterium]
VLRVVAGSDIIGTTIDAQGDLLIGANTSSAAAGTAAVTLGDMTSLLAFSELVCEDLIVGDANGGQGSLSLRSGVLRCASARFVGGHSALTIEQGVIDCSGPFIWENGPLTIDGIDSAGLLFQGVTTLDFPIRFGVARDGHIGVAGPSADVTVNGDITLGEQSTGHGDIDVSSRGTLTVAGTVHLGVAGNSSLATQSGGMFVADSLVVAATSGSEAAISIGSNSAVGTLDALYLGGTSLGPGGTADVSISNGVLSAQDVVVCWGGTTIDVNSGQIVSNANISMRAGSSVTMSSSTLRATGLNFAGALNAVGDGVDLTGSGEVEAAITGTGTGNDITATGPLSLGLPSSVNGYSGTNIDLSVGPHTVTLGDANNADIGNTTIAGGTLLTVQSINIPPGKTVSGGGTIDARFILNAGNINATTPQGFVLKGIVSGTGPLTGTLFDFSNTGGFSGRDTLNSQIRGSAGSVITATGNLTLGTATSTGFSFDGTIITNTNQVTLRDTSIAAVGNVQLGGGSLFCTDTDLASDLNDVASGFGTIVTTPRTWINAGTIRPDGLGAPVIGQISTLGNVNMENVFDTAVIDLDIGGTSNATM